MPTFSTLITNAADNGRWFSTGAWNDAIDFASAGSWAGFRFRNVTIPQGAEVATATLTINMRSAFGGSGTLSIFDTDNCPLFASNQQTNPQISAGPLSSGRTAVYDIAAPLGQVLARDGWASGGAVGFIAAITSGTFEFWDTVNSQNLSAALNVEWELPPITATAQPATLERVVPAVTLASEFRLAAQPAALEHVVPIAQMVAPMVLVAHPAMVERVTPPATLTGTGQAPPLTAQPALAEHVVPAATLVATVKPPPPPPPWQDAVTSPAYQAALQARTATIDTRVDVIDEQDVVIARLGGPDATHPGVLGGTVTMDAGRDTRWTGSLSIDQADLIPTTPGDLLHPLSYNRVRIWWRILTDPATGQWVEIPCGTMYTAWPQVTDDGTANPAVSVTGADAATLIARAQMTTSVAVGGMSIDAAVRAILTEAAPWATLDLDPTDHRLPAEYEAGEPGANPWKVCQELVARSSGLTLHVDRMGAVRLTTRTAPTSAPVAEWIEGHGCAMTDVSATVPFDQVRNRVVVESTATQDADGNDIEPVTATAAIDDPTHPLWVGHGHYYDERIETDAVTTQAQADDLAASTLAERSALVEETEVVIAPHPHLEAGDVTQVSTTRAGVSGARQVAAWSLTLGDTGGQRVTLNGRRDW